MISDVVADALRAIEDYENDPLHAAWYADAETKERIATCKAAMAALRVHLDSPPSAVLAARGLG